MTIFCRGHRVHNFYLSGSGVVTTPIFFTLFEYGSLHLVVASASNATDLHWVWHGFSLLGPIEAMVLFVGGLLFLPFTYFGVSLLSMPFLLTLVVGITFMVHFWVAHLSMELYFGGDLGFWQGKLWWHGLPRGGACSSLLAFGIAVCFIVWVFPFAGECFLSLLYGVLMLYVGWFIAADFQGHVLAFVFWLGTFFLLARLYFLGDPFALIFVSFLYVSF